MMSRVSRDYKSMTDEEVALTVQQVHDEEGTTYLMRKYGNLVRAKARSYFLIGADNDDIIQEGMIGLYKAIRDFKADRNVSFRAFAEICITRQIITAIKAATRQKQMPLNSYVSLNKPIYTDESERTLMDVLSSLSVSDPEELFVTKETYSGLQGALEEILSDLEWRVLQAYLEGDSYAIMSERIGRDMKSIDNALQRVKRKVEEYLKEREHISRRN